MHTIVSDLRHSIRVLLRSRALTLAILFSTALGVGATASVFSLVDAFLLRPLTVPDSSGVVRLTSVSSSGPVGRFSYPEFEDIRRGARAFSGFATAQNAVFGVAKESQQPRYAIGIFVNGDFFSTLRVRPIIGRGFLPEEDQVPERNPVLVLGYEYWQREFGGAADVVGSRVRLNAREFTVVGVAPPEFTGVHPFLRPQVFVPRMMMPALATSLSASNPMANREARSVEVFGRLQSGISLNQAQEDVALLAADMARQHPETNKDRGATVYSQMAYRIAEAPDNFTLAGLLFGVAGLVLLIASVNVVNLLLSTAPARMREIALRTAIGAARVRILRQLLIESAILAVLGSTLGLALAYFCADFISAIEIASDLPLKMDARVDSRVALFGLAVGLLSGILTGVVPAIRASRPQLLTLLKATDGRSGRIRTWGRQVLVAGQVAVALVVLIISGLFIEALRVARTSDPGFRVDNILTAGLDPRIAGYDKDRSLRLYDSLTERLRSMPGVRSVGLGQHVPLGVSSSSVDVRLEGLEGTSDPEVTVRSSIVGPGYLETMGIPVLRGRAFDSRDVAGTPGVVIVNEEMATKYLAGVDPIGRSIDVRLNTGRTEKLTIVGVARNSKYADPAELPIPFVYLPLAQASPPGMMVFVQTDGTLTFGADTLRQEIATLDPNLPIYDVRTMQHHFQQQALWGARLVAQIVTFVALVGVALGVLGLYGVIAYAVSRRTREIGIRMALGAERGAVQRMVLWQGLKLSLAGIVVGLGLVFLLVPVLGSLLNSVNTVDPVIYTAAVISLLAVTALASFVPARWASRVDPNRTLRMD